MNRTKGLAPFSAKRLAEIQAAGTFPQSTFTTRSAPIQQSREPKPRRVRDAGFSKSTVGLIIARDLGCVRCGAPIRGERGMGWSVQHRRARGNGGSRRPDTNQTQNGLILCGSATTSCHGAVESGRAEAREFGWAIRQSDDPLTYPVLHARHGWVRLDAAGGWVPSGPIEVAA